MIRPLRSLLAGFAGAIVALAAAGKPGLATYFPEAAGFDPRVPTPSQFFGYEVGEWHLRHDQVVAYLQALAAASPRMKLEETGRTFEQRRLLLATFATPGRLAGIEEVRAAHLAALDPAKPAPADRPAVVWLAYGVHGNESSAMNAAVLMAYWLAAAPQAGEWLQDLVVLLDPAINPDGNDRHALWANTHRGVTPAADPAHREHHEIWPGGRFNHWWFDLNRDYASLVHPESRARTARYVAWRPTVYGDWHEMGTNSTYFFQPGEPTRVHPLIPKSNQTLTAEIAQFHARRLDGVGALYYTRDRFDDFYVGKGSTYTDVTGTIGILFEQASSRGHRQRSTEAGVLDFPTTIRHQVATSLSTLEAARTLRPRLLEFQRGFFAESAQLARAAGFGGWVFGAAGDPARGAALADTLRRHGAEVRALTRDATVDGTTFRAGAAWFVPAAQPLYRFLTALFERRTKFEDNTFYDISGWTLPLAFHLPVATVAAGAVETGADAPSAGRFTDSPAALAFAFGWEGLHAPRALQRLLHAGLKVRMAKEPAEFPTVGGRVALGHGALVVPLALQPGRAAEVRALAAQIAREDGIDVSPVLGGLALAGPDLGSATLAMLEPRRVALVVGEGVGVTDAGELWHLLDYRLGLEVSLLDTGRLPRVRLADYTTIILPDGNYDRWEAATVEALRAWVRGGGTLIATGRAVTWAIQRELVKEELVKREERGGAAEAETYDSREAAGAVHRIAGAIFGSTVDRTHPLAFGLGPGELPVFRDNTVFLRPARNPRATPVRFTAQPLLSGYCSDENQKQMAGSAAVLASDLGSGLVVLMPINPTFRGFWRGTEKLVANAVFFSPAVRQAVPDFGGEN